MSIASSLVDQYVAKEKAKEGTVLLDVGSGFIAVTAEMAKKCVEQGIGKIAGKPHSLFGYEPR
jgi:16S rRNA A1518/A1519 N6-dimethyltransferase RsmA/KsgA/DIM1 with predicted DNA glycosylase/AP lyase activity